MRSKRNTRLRINVQEFLDLAFKVYSQMFSTNTWETGRRIRIRIPATGAPCGVIVSKS